MKVKLVFSGKTPAVKPVVIYLRQVGSGFKRFWKRKAPWMSLISIRALKTESNDYLALALCILSACFLTFSGFL